MSNLTERMLFCTRHWEDNGSYLLNWYKTFASLYVLLSVAVTSSNILILIALYKDRTLHAPSKLLLRCLSFTDLCVGLLALPASIVFAMSAVHERWELCRFTKYSVYVITTTLSGVSLGTLCTISVDRLLALLLRLRYRQVVTLKRVRIVVFFLWMKSSSVGFVYIFSMRAFFIVSAVLIAAQIAIPFYCYTKIFRVLHLHQTQVRENLGQGTLTTGTASNMAMYKKTVFSALWVHLTLATCFLPFSVVTTVTAVRGLTTSAFLPEGFAVTMVYMNSLLNPGLYCWKIKEVRRALKEIIMQICRAAP